jgi:nicotinate-nucleotide--dimethylbenzimidazole phosphoribosyltransferase
MAASYDIPATSADFALQMRAQLGHLDGQPAALLSRIAAIQQTIKPVITRPVAMVFGSNHGVILPHFPEIALEADAVLTNILGKDDPVFGVMPKDMHLRIVDAGLGPAYRNFLNFWLHMEELMELPGHWDPSEDFTNQRAMNTKSCRKAMKEGARLADKHHQRGSNLLALGTLGKMSIPAALALTAAIHEQSIQEVLPVADWKRFFPNLKTDPERVWRKLSLPLKNNPKTRDPVTLLSLYGAPDLAMMTGAILKAAALKMAIVLDGVGALVAANVARRLHPEVSGYLFSAAPFETRSTRILGADIAAPVVLGIDYNRNDLVQLAWAARHLSELSGLFGGQHHQDSSWL